MRATIVPGVRQDSKAGAGREPVFCPPMFRCVQPIVAPPRAFARQCFDACSLLQQGGLRSLRAFGVCRC
eukprot:4604311-Lingulodinium_polyedra.AAC.1